MTNDIKTKAGRAKLEPRKDSPYYERHGAAALGFRCTAAGGEGTWMARVYEGGKYHYQPLGRFDDYREAVKALEAWMDARKAAAQAGVSVSAAQMTVADACRGYLAEFARKKGEGQQHRYAQNILELKVVGRPAAKRKTAVEPHAIAGVRLADLTKPQFTAWRDGLLPVTEAKAARPQRATAARHFKALVAVLNWTHQNALIGTDVAWRGVKNFANVQASADESHIYLTPAQRAALLSACDGTLRDFVELLALIGARPVELFRATVADFDARTGTLNLWDEKGKTGRRVRAVPLAALKAGDLVKRLAKNKLPAAPLFDHGGDSQFYLRPFKAAATAAGLPAEATAYCLRHSFITDAVGAGVPLLTVARTVGTSVAQIEKTYAKNLPDAALAAFARMHA
jgi:integrase